MFEITSVWVSPDRTYLVVQTDGEEGPVTGIDTTATHPDGVTFECHEQDVVDATFMELYPQSAENKLDAIRELIDTHKQRGTALAYEIREVLGS